MSGILDSKSRILDAFLTTEGRRQVAAGTFEVSYVTFTDNAVAYQADKSEGHVDPTNRIYLEACNLPQDQITFEANDEGNLVPIRKQPTLQTPGLSIPGVEAPAVLNDGRLVVNSYYHGRRVTATGIKNQVGGFGPGLVFNPINDGSGFVYTDNNMNVPAQVLLTSSFGRDKDGNVVVKASASPFVAYIGTKDGFGLEEFAVAVSESIARIKNLGGPSVECYAKNGSVYMDFDKSYVRTKFYATGTLNFNLVLETARRGGRLLTDEVEESLFASHMAGILTSSIDNFVEMQTIGSVNRIFDDKEFVLSNEEMKFDMKDVNSIFATMKTPPSVNSIDSIFNDDKLSHLENFMYLPPILKTPDSLIPNKSNVESLQPYLLGNYPSWGDNEKKLTFQKLQEHVNSFNNKQLPIVFKRSSLRNNVVGQFFEVTSKGVCKLDVVDFGPIMNDVQEPTAVTDHVFFVGKIFLDDRGTTCFVNMFTLIFSKSPEEESDLAL